MHATPEQEILDRAAPAADVRIPYGAETAQFGDLRLPTTPGPWPVVIVIHGGFWRARFDLLHIGHLCAALTARGAATWSLEYRRVGEPGGGWPGTLEDVAQGSAHLSQLAREYPLDLERVIIIGHSAGGHLALWLAAERRPFKLLAAISLAGVVDLRRAAALGLGHGAAEAFLGGSPVDLPERYTAASPRERLPLGVKQILIHGEDDDIVPIDLSRAYYAAAVQRGDQLRLHALPSTGHFAVIDPRSDAWPTVEAAVTSLLGL